MEMQCEKLDEEMPIPDENTKQNLSNVPNSKLDSKDYNSHK